MKLLIFLLLFSKLYSQGNYASQYHSVVHRDSGYTDLFLKIYPPEYDHSRDTTISDLSWRLDVSVYHGESLYEHTMIKGTYKNGGIFLWMRSDSIFINDKLKWTYIDNIDKPHNLFPLSKLLYMGKNVYAFRLFDNSTITIYDVGFTY